MAKNLTLKQQKFLELRLEKGLKGAEAYRQAYGAKMPPPLCAKQAYRLLHNPKIKAYLDRAEQVADSRIETAIARYAVSRERTWPSSPAWPMQTSPITPPLSAGAGDQSAGGDRIIWRQYRRLPSRITRKGGVRTHATFGGPGSSSLTSRQQSKAEPDVRLAHRQERNWQTG
jgi:hypothetical protein